MDIERKELWGTTKASNLAILGFVLGLLGSYLALKYYISLLIISGLGICVILYSLYLNYHQGFNVRWRLVNFIIHFIMLIIVVVEIVYVLLRVYN